MALKGDLASVDLAQAYFLWRQQEVVESTVSEFVAKLGPAARFQRTDVADADQVQAMVGAPTQKPRDPWAMLHPNQAWLFFFGRRAFTSKPMSRASYPGVSDIHCQGPQVTMLLEGGAVGEPQSGPDERRQLSDTQCG